MKVNKKLGDIEVLSSSCNISTVKDGRGAILTWLPDRPIVEFNMLYFLPNKIRGNHYHPEFVEYFLIVSGSVIMVTNDPETDEEDIKNFSNVLGVNIEPATINGGIPFVSSGILANSNAVVVGNLTNGPEIMMLTRAFTN